MHNLLKKILYSTLGMLTLLGISATATSNVHASKWHNSMPSEFNKTSIWMSTPKRANNSNWYYQSSATRIGRHIGPDPIELGFTSHGKFVGNGNDSGASLPYHPYSKSIGKNKYDVLAGNKTRSQDYKSLSTTDTSANTSLQTNIKTYGHNHFKLWYMKDGFGDPTTYGGYFHRTKFHNWNSFWNAINTSRIYEARSKNSSIINKFNKKKLQYVPTKVVKRFDRAFHLSKYTTHHFHIPLMLNYTSKHNHKVGYTFNFASYGTIRDIYYKRHSRRSLYVVSRSFIANALVNGMTAFLLKGPKFKTFKIFKSKGLSVLVSFLEGLSKISKFIKSHTMSHKYYSINRLLTPTMQPNSHSNL